MFACTGDKGTALVMSREAEPEYGSEESVGDRTSERSGARGRDKVDGDTPPAGALPQAVVRTEGPEEIGAATQRRLLGAFPISALAAPGTVRGSCRTRSVWSTSAP